MLVSDIIGTVVLAIIPILEIAYALTSFELLNKGKLGELSKVEFSKHKTHIIDEYVCTDKELEKLLKDFK